MSYTPYLASIIEALSKRVHPHIADTRGRDALEACIRALAGMAAALSDAPNTERLPLPPAVTALDLPPVIDEPPENLAANNRTAPQVAAGAEWLAHEPWLANRDARRAAETMLRWERDTIAPKIAWMRAAEQQAAVGNDDIGRLQIDRGALDRYLKRRCGAAARITFFRQAVGGRSRQTAVFTLEGTDLPSQLVVQRDHPASITRDGIERQFPVLELLSQTALKVSRPLLLEIDRTILGAPFMIVEAAPGIVAGADYFNPPRVPALALELAGQLAILHSTDPSSLLTQLRTTTKGPNGWTAELDAIEAAWRQFAHAPSLTVSAAFAWMRAHVHQIGDDLSIVHNDASFHNILVDNGHFSALLDFELVHLGHPAEDLGYCRPFVQEMTEWNEFVKAYVVAGGRQYEPDVLDYFSLRGGIHLLTLLQYGRSKFKSGDTTDINLAEVATSFIPKLHARVARMMEVVLHPHSASPTD